MSGVDKTCPAYVRFETARNNVVAYEKSHLGPNDRKTPEYLQLMSVFTAADQGLEKPNP